ncbi:MAG: menaquinol oxidoreductase [Chloroflexi bacterium]|nr:MAG: menaquinol oxidoreductase [Chloroflexota bacterium]
MKHKKPWWKQPGIQIGAVLVAFIVIGGIIGGIFLTQTPPEQPIAFPHNRHVGIGASCLYCHAGATLGPSAGLPGIEKCWGCHQQVQKQSPELTKLAGYVERNEPIPWVPVAIQPEFVRFKHSPHVNAGLQCSACHGDLAKMTVAEAQKGQNMGWCLQCHKSSAPEQWTKLSDCATCHY